MDPFMNFQLWSFNKSLATLYTGIRFLASVDSYVIPQVLWRVKNILYTWCRCKESRQCGSFCVSSEYWSGKKNLPHKVQEYNCSPVCVSLCDFKFERLENDFLQKLQTKGCFTTWIWLWAFKFLRLWKVLSHTWHIWSKAFSRLKATNP